MTMLCTNCLEALARECDEAIDAATKSCLQLRRLARNLRSQRRRWTALLRMVSVFGRKISLHELWSGQACELAQALRESTLHCLGRKRILRPKIVVKGAMSQARRPGDIGDAGLVEPAAPHLSGSCLQDRIAIVGCLGLRNLH